MKPSNSVSYVLACAILIALAFLPQTAVAGDGVCGTAQANCDQGEAFGVCQVNLTYTIQYHRNLNRNPEIKKGCTAASATSYACDVGIVGYSSYTGCYKSGGSIKQDVYFYGSTCASKPPMVAGLVGGAHSGEVCLDGCIYVKGSAVPDSYELGDSPARVVTLLTSWAPNGAVCHAGGPLPQPKGEPECLAITGMTQCVKPDGSHCATGAKGTQFCWGKGDNEPDKNNGDEYANRGQNGPGPPPATPPAGGGVWGPPQNCVPMSRTVNGYRQTYTVCGGNGGPPDDDDDPDDPDDPDEPCDPATEDCEPGDSTGGEDCAAPPSSTGDKLLAAVIKQQWLVRCGKSKSDEDGDGQPDWTKPGEGDHVDPGPDEEPDELATLNISTGLLDTTGMIGGGSCPSIGAIDIAGLATVSVDAEPWWCPMISLMRAVVLMMAAFTSLKLLMGGS